MISYVKIKPTADKAKNWVKGVCTSDDTKPIDGIANGSKLLELDTGKRCVYDEGRSVWIEYGTGEDRMPRYRKTVIEGTLLNPFGNDIRKLPEEWLDNNEVYGTDIGSLLQKIYHGKAFARLSFVCKPNGINVGEVGNLFACPDYRNFGIPIPDDDYHYGIFMFSNDADAYHQARLGNYLMAPDSSAFPDESPENREVLELNEAIRKHMLTTITRDSDTIITDLSLRTSRKFKFIFDSNGYALSFYVCDGDTPYLYGMCGDLNPLNWESNLRQFLESSKTTLTVYELMTDPTPEPTVKTETLSGHLSTIFENIERDYMGILAADLIANKANISMRLHLSADNPLDVPKMDMNINADAFMMSSTAFMISLSAVLENAQGFIIVYTFGDAGFTISDTQGNRITDENFEAMLGVDHIDLVITHIEEE